jgi:hypothetical protein
MASLEVFACRRPRAPQRNPARKASVPKAEPVQADTWPQRGQQDDAEDERTEPPPLRGTQDPQVAAPSETEEPEAKEPEAKEPEAKEPEAKEPEAKEPEAKEPEAKEPEAKQEEQEAVPKSTMADAKDGKGCIMPEIQTVVPGPASGWQDAVQAASEAEQDADMDDAEEHDGCTAKAEPHAAGDAVDFFFLDALYEPVMVGTVLLIGKVREGSEYVSACVCVREMKQCLYIVPKPFVFQDSDGDIRRWALAAAALQVHPAHTCMRTPGCACRLHERVTAGEEGKGKLLKLLHSRAAELKREVREALGRHCSEMALKPVLRTYAFEDERIRPGPQWVLKVTCNAAPGAVPHQLSGRTFAAILGTTQTPLEALQLKRKLMGPSWLRLAGAARVDSKAQLSWCRVRATRKAYSREWANSSIAASSHVSGRACT